MQMGASLSPWQQVLGQAVLGVLRILFPPLDFTSTIPETQLHRETVAILRESSLYFLKFSASPPLVPEDADTSQPRALQAVGAFPVGVSPIAQGEASESSEPTTARVRCHPDPACSTFDS